MISRERRAKKSIDVSGVVGAGKKKKRKSKREERKVCLKFKVAEECEELRDGKIFAREKSMSMMWGNLCCGCRFRIPFFSGLYSNENLFTQAKRNASTFIRRDELKFRAQRVSIFSSPSSVVWEGKRQTLESENFFGIFRVVREEEEHDGEKFSFLI